MCVGGSPPKPEPVKVPDPAPTPPPPEETAEAPVVEGPGRSERKAAQRAAGAGKSSLRIDLNVPSGQSASQTATGLNIPQG